MPLQLFRRRPLLLAILILIGGLALRIASFTWNTQLKGDVNLMALTAREFVQHDRLYYPMIFGTSKLKPLMTLDPIGTPATQHPPLYPFLAGALGKLSGTDDTFSLLKLIDEIGGLALLGASLWAVRHSGETRPALAAGAMIALAPTLVDFSANGSPYILAALALLLAIFLLRAFHMDSPRDYALAGLLCGIGLQFHNILIGLPAAFVGLWIIERRHIHWKGVGSFVLVVILTLVPWTAWNLTTLGVPLYSSSTNYALKRLAISSFDQMIEPAILLRCLRLSFGTLKHFVKYGFLEVGPFALLLALAGGYSLIRGDRRAALAVGLPAATYLAVALAWPGFKYRFLVPVLPILALLAGFGFARLPDLLPGRLTAARVATWLLLVGAIGWGLPGFWHNPPTRYYSLQVEERIARQYPIMRRLAEEMRQREPGVMLGFSTTLDSGIETVYWSRLPFVAGGAQPAELKPLVDEYHVRYVWADRTTGKGVEAAFPGAQVILRDVPFIVYQLPGSY